MCSATFLIAFELIFTQYLFDESAYKLRQMFIPVANKENVSAFIYLISKNLSADIQVGKCSRRSIF